MYMFAQRVSFQEDITVTKDIISSISLFESLTPNQIQTLLSTMQVRHCSQGERIYTAGDKPTELYTVLNGRVDFVVGKGRVHHIQDSYTTGNMFGETAAGNSNAQIGTAIASTIDVELLVLTLAGLDTIKAEDGELFGKLMVNITRDKHQKAYLN